MGGEDLIIHNSVWWEEKRPENVGSKSPTRRDGVGGQSVTGRGVIDSLQGSLLGVRWGVEASEMRERKTGAFKRRRRDFLGKVGLIAKKREDEIEEKDFVELYGKREEGGRGAGKEGRKSRSHNRLFWVLY